MLVPKKNTVKVKKATSIFVAPVTPPPSDPNSDNKLNEYHLLKPENIQPGRYKAELMEALEVTHTYSTEDNPGKTWDSTDLELYYHLTPFTPIADQPVYKIRFRYFKNKPQYTSLMKAFQSYGLANNSFASFIGIVEDVTLIFPDGSAFGQFSPRTLLYMPPEVQQLVNTQNPNSPVIPPDEEMPF